MNIIRFPGATRSKALIAALGILFLGGCATFSQDGGFDAVEGIAKDRINKEVKWNRSESNADSIQASVKKLLASPLSVNDAVQIALLNNRGLQATYAELGIAEADLVQAGRLRNPGFSFGRTHAGDDIKIERTFVFDFLGLLTIPLRTKIEGQRFEQVKLLVANEVLRVAAETQKAYYQAVATEQTVRYFEQVKTAAEASAELARRMARAGNFSKLDQAREQAFYAETTAQLARARQTEVAQREKLARLMGLWGNDVQFKLPERLPELPAAKPELKNLEALAIEQRLDIQAARREIAWLADSLGLTKATRFVNVLDLGYVRNSETGKPRETGYKIFLEIPLFDWGSARVAKAEAIYMQAANRVANTAINARSEVRESYSAYVTAYELAKHYRDEVVPLRKKISEENLLRYNGMLISVFELLADAREQVASVNAYIDSLREFWIAETDLQRSLGGKLPVTKVSAAPSSGSGGSAVPEMKKLAAKDTVQHQNQGKEN